MNKNNSYKSKFQRKNNRSISKVKRKFKNHVKRKVTSKKKEEIPVIMSRLRISQIVWNLNLRKMRIHSSQLIKRSWLSALEI